MHTRLARTAAKSSTPSQKHRSRVVTRQAHALVEQMEVRRHLSATNVAALQAGFTGDADRVSSDLLAEYAGGATSPAASAIAVAAGSGNPLQLQRDPSGRVGVVITAKDPGALIAPLTALGAAVAASLPTYHRIEAYLPLSALPAVSQLGNLGLLGVTGVVRPVTNAGSIDSQADNVLEADRVRATTPGYDGTGVKVGVISDSYDENTSSPASADVASGDLPANVQVLQEDPYAGGVDEGRAMLQLIHDVAPGAGLGFATADASESGYADNIRALAAAGYKVITDDVYYYDEPYFQDGIVAQAVNDVVAGGVSYFSSAGNSADVAYDSGSSAAYGSSPLNFVTTTIPALTSSALSYYDWDPTPAGTQTEMPVTIPVGSTAIWDLQWDQPFYTTAGVTTDLDFFLLSTDPATGQQRVELADQTDNVANQAPVSVIGWYNDGTGPNDAAGQYDLVIVNGNGGPIPGRLKFVDTQDDPSVTYGDHFTNSPTIFGHNAAAGAMSVAASDVFHQGTPEAFSSTGPATILFNADGSRKATPEVRAKPDLMATDGSDTSFFAPYPNSDVDGNGFPNFYGTSAAAPNAAAVAALLLQANPSFTPAQVYARLKSTADGSVGGGNPNQIGAGMIDAYRAIFGGPVAAPTLLSDGFESGALGNDWQVYKQESAVVEVTSAFAPATGKDRLVLSDNIGSATHTFFHQPGLAEATLHLNLAGKSAVALSFSEKEFAQESDNAMPASFTGHGLYDGVAFSVDGTHWYRLFSLTGTSSTATFQKLSANLSAAAAAVGVKLTADTRVKFQEYAELQNGLGVTGIALDNVLVSAQSSIAGIVIDDGTAQRSRVRSITLNVTGNLSTVPASAFSLVNTSCGGGAVPVLVSSVTHPTTSTTKIVLTFGGRSLDYGSLSDGTYRLTINGSAITDSAGRSLDADGNGVDGGSRSISFSRFFGDSNGDGAVNATDLLAFASAFASGHATGANSAYDYNGDGTFSATDLIAFLRRYLEHHV